VTDAEILAAVTNVAREHLAFEGELRPEQRLIEDLELDSIKALTLVVEVENRFRIALAPELETEIVTVGDLVRVVGGLIDDPR
jgi:acyl carrier protein